MKVSEKIRNVMVKLQSLPEQSKKVIIWSIVAIIGVIMGYFWVTGVISSFPKIAEATKIDVPSIGNSNTQALANVAGAISTQADSVDMSSWQTYTNDKYGFQIKYPPDLKYQEHELSQAEIDSQVVLGAPGHVIFTFLLAEDPTAKIVSDGIEVEIQKRETDSPIPDTNEREYAVESNGYVYIISLFGSDNNLNNIFNTVVSDFQLTK